MRQPNGPYLAVCVINSDVSRQASKMDPLLLDRQQPIRFLTSLQCGHKTYGAGFWRGVHQHHPGWGSIGLHQSNEFSDSLGLDLCRALDHRQNTLFWPGAGRRGQRRKCLAAKVDGIIASDRCAFGLIRSCLGNLGVIGGNISCNAPNPMVSCSLWLSSSPRAYSGA